MAMKNTLTEDVILDALPRTIKRNISGAENVVVSNISIPQSSGLSAETVMFSASWQVAGLSTSRNFVARVQPSGPALFMDYDPLRSGKSRPSTTVVRPDAKLGKSRRSLAESPERIVR